MNYMGKLFWKLEEGLSLRGMFSIFSLDKLCTFLVNTYFLGFTLCAFVPYLF